MSDSQKLTGVASFTNSSLACFRRCPREFELRYMQRLERDIDEESEALAVGSCWHDGQETLALKGEAEAYEQIRRTAPNNVWAEKLCRLLAAHSWYWQGQQVKVVEPEVEFEVEHEGFVFRGKRDAIVELPDGRRGLLEYKTTSSDVSAESSYWDRLRLDTQVGLYAMAMDEPPSFILYDVVRKPTINPKKISKAEVDRMRREIQKDGRCRYFEDLEAWQVEPALAEAFESPLLYGARLTADIGDRPSYYFARREVPRTRDDYERLAEDLVATAALVRDGANGWGLPRNPDSCATFGLCDFFRLCSNNVRPEDGTVPPEGFRRRERLHPELGDSTPAQ